MRAVRAVGADVVCVQYELLELMLLYYRCTDFQLDDLLNILSHFRVYIACAFLATFHHTSSFISCDQRWNVLDEGTVSSSSINVFKNRLNKIRLTRMGYFMDWL